ncbi:MAG TPA: asparagine synthase (glutamine-hydrolyzing) [Nitrospiria bacterium]|nr:asparagine synthase (glutamine-hydrolyzing) [Nitrospiria bacterium]
MCGICGIMRWDGRTVSATTVRAMTDALTHRGPDGEGLFIRPTAGKRGEHSERDANSVGLGNRRLAVIDPEGGRQPVSNEDGTVTVVYNGEIYNYRELRQSLEASGHRFKSRSDTEVIVHQYEQDGWRCVERFRGMFAFALWDETNGLLLLARDRLGIKPLYYTVHGDRLLFASEIWALLRGLGQTPALDPVALAQLFLVQYVPSPLTIMSNIYKLPAGTAAVVRSGKLELRPYWRPHAAPPPSYPPDADLARALLERLDDSVASHLVSDVPLGAFLSGGLDSSMIVASMRRRVDTPVHTFAVGFEGMAGEGELEHARRVASVMRTTHHELVVTEPNFIDALPRMVAALDDPVLDPALVPTLLVSRLARSEVTVVLTGEGGDELFGGYRRYRLQRWNRVMRLVPEAVRPLLIGLARSLRVRQALEAYWQKGPSGRHLGWAATAPPSLMRQLWEEPDRADQAAAGLRGGFDRLLAERHPEGGEDPTDERALDAMLDLDMRTWLPDDLLVKVDRMAMAVSLEARVPYLDHQLVEWASALPASMKVRGGTGKYLLKQAAMDRLPASIVRRPKQGFEPPLAHWLRGGMGRRALDDINGSAVGQLGLWNGRTITQWFGAHQRGEDDYSLLLWGVWLFALWYDHLMAFGRTLTGRDEGDRG